jgi:hypothetical protein
VIAFPPLEAEMDIKALQAGFRGEIFMPGSAVCDPAQRPEAEHKSADVRCCDRLAILSLITALLPD